MAITASRSWGYFDPRHTFMSADTVVSNMVWRIKEWAAAMRSLKYMITTSRRETPRKIMPAWGACVFCEPFFFFFFFFFQWRSIMQFGRKNKSLFYKPPHYDVELNFLWSSLIQCPISYHIVANECLWKHTEIQQIQISIRTCIRLRDVLLTEKWIENTKKRSISHCWRNCEITP